jgi:hypothetical protein
MAVPTGRNDKRIPRHVLVELAPPGTQDFKEAAIAENVSARGMRVATERVWYPGDSVLLSSPESGFRTQARVVYCQRLESNKFAVGLELVAPLMEWPEAH